MKKIITSLAVASAVLMAGGPIKPIEGPSITPIEETCTAFVPSGYVGISAIWGEFGLASVQPVGQGGINIDEDNIGIGLQAGYDIFGQDNWILGVEARYGFVSLDTYDASYIAAYLKPQYKIDDLGVYGLIGYGRTDYSVSGDFYGGTLTYDTSADDFTYGAGITYDVADNVEVFVDYIMLPDFQAGNADTVDSDVVTLGVNYRFGSGKQPK